MGTVHTIFTFLPSLQRFCVLFVCKRRWSSLTYKAISNLLNEDTYRSVCVGNHPSKQIEQVVHYIILNFLNEESVSGESGGRVCL